MLGIIIILRLFLLINLLRPKEVQALLLLEKKFPEDCNITEYYETSNLSCQECPPNSVKLDSKVFCTQF